MAGPAETCQMIFLVLKLEYLKIPCSFFYPQYTAIWVFEAHDGGLAGNLDGEWRVEDNLLFLPGKPHGSKLSPITFSLLYYINR